MVYFVLNNIRSAWNVGAIMRTCDALGYGLILVGYTPKPVGATLALVKKTSIGAENTVNWEHFEHYQEVLISKSDGRHIGIEISDTSSNIFDYLNQNSVIIDTDYYLWFGNEISGLEKALIIQLDTELHLPMNGKKESLNVSNSSCAVGYLFLEHLEK
ncbi:MAG: TrmH family RNA methyltransferase [candidate division SR1 bacterium]|nr:TrmH family RNA methyltransferase [candidate division SR1 bacterium]